MKEQIISFGYSKPDPDTGKWTAICVNMCLFAQGDSPEEAFTKITRAISNYIDYIQETYPQNWQGYLYHPAPDEFIAEFKEVTKELFERATKPKITKESPFSQPRMVFEIPNAYAETGV